MKQARATIRQRIEQGRAVLAWLKGHAAAAMAVTLFFIAAVWLAEHDARIQREAELGMIRREVTAEVSALRQRAQAAVEQSRASEHVIRDLEARRGVLEREASLLRARLNSLREEDRLRVRPAITPGHNDAAGSATSRPGPAAFGIRDSGLAGRDSGLGTRDSRLATGGASAELPDFRFELSEFQCGR